MVMASSVPSCRRASGSTSKSEATASVSPLINWKRVLRSPPTTRPSRRGSTSSTGGGYFVRLKAPSHHKAKQKDVESPARISWARGPVMDVQQKSLAEKKPMPILECSFYKKMNKESTSLPASTEYVTPTQDAASITSQNDMYFL